MMAGDVHYPHEIIILFPLARYEKNIHNLHVTDVV